jgi:acetoacetyl-CoA synthetase
MTRYLRTVRENLAPAVVDYPSLHRWSIEEPGAFWRSVWSFCGIRAMRQADAVVSGIGMMPGAQWFPGARLSFAENLLSRNDDHPAIISRDESGNRAILTHRELRERVAALAAALREDGVGAGERVAGFLPNVAQTVIAMLAANSLGAVWSSCSPDFGVHAVVDRFAQIAPRVLVTTGECRYAGKRILLGDRIRGILDRLPSVRRVVLAGGAEGSALRSLPGAVTMDEYARRPAPPLEFASLPFDHPLYVMYSSGTTGIPKGIVHGAGGTLIQHLKELILHTDLKPDDTIFYHTTCGWMMWNWLVSSLAVGATIVLYDGSPVHPSADALWRMAAEEGVTVFGTSAPYLSAVEKAGLSPGRDHDLSRLRTILSTGAPLAPRSYDYVYGSIKDDVCLSSISGGTDIISCFGLGNPLGPVYRGEIQCRGLGMKVEILDETGRPVSEGKGELCCTLAFPSMPVGFWNDPDGRRYRAAYFEKLPGVWCHGDYAELTAHGGLVIHGRSDAVLNPGGVRIGTAEIYRVVERMPEVRESIAVGRQRDGDVRVILFVVLAAGATLDEPLRERIRQALRTEASPRHVPSLILQVTEIPRTISGKIVELAVHRVVNGQPVENRDVLANPEALDQFARIPELTDPA